MHPYLLLLTIDAMLLGVAVLVYTIRRLVRLLRASVVARLPAAAEQSVSFGEPGTYILHVEHPRFTTALSRAGYGLRHAASGQDVRSWPIVFRTISSGFDTVRIPVRGFAVDHSGPHTLCVTGIRPGGDTSKDLLVFTRPYAAAMVMLILGIILGAFCFIGGMVFAGLELAGK